MPPSVQTVALVFGPGRFDWPNCEQAASASACPEVEAGAPDPGMPDRSAGRAPRRPWSRRADLHDASNRRFLRIGEDSDLSSRRLPEHRWPWTHLSVRARSVKAWLVRSPNRSLVLDLLGIYKYIGGVLNKQRVVPK